MSGRDTYTFTFSGKRSDRALHAFFEAFRARRGISGAAAFREVVQSAAILSGLLDTLPNVREYLAAMTVEGGEQIADALAAAYTECGRAHDLSLIPSAERLAAMEPDTTP